MEYLEGGEPVLSKNSSSAVRENASAQNHGSMRCNRISVCIVCRNEADKLGPCLESVAWTDEIVLMDLSSTDGSAAVGQQHGAHVVTREAVPVVELVRNDVAAEASNDWILALDPDERITPGLAQWLRQVAQRQNVDAVVIPRMNFDLGYPPSHRRQRYEPQLRMYRRSRVEWPVIPNALPRVPEDRLFRIPSRDELVMIHDRNRNIPEALDRAYRYAPIEAQSMLDRGQTFSAPGMARYMASTAYTQFIAAQAWRDGVPGMLRAGILVGFKFYIWAALWQASGAQRTPADDRFVRRLGVVMELVRKVVHVTTTMRRYVKRMFGFLRKWRQYRGSSKVTDVRS